MGTAKSNHALGKPVNLLMLFKLGPVNPTGFIVLTVGVVVAALRAAEFISAQQHRHAARNQQGQQKILDLAFSDGVVSKNSNAVYSRGFPLIVTQKHYRRDDDWISNFQDLTPFALS
jgi:hypothetical protein